MNTCILKWRDKSYENIKGEKLNIRNIIMSGNSHVRYCKNSYYVSN